MLYNIVMKSYKKIKFRFLKGTMPDQPVGEGSILQPRSPAFADVMQFMSEEELAKSKELSQLAAKMLEEAAPLLKRLRRVRSADLADDFDISKTDLPLWFSDIQIVTATRDSLKKCFKAIEDHFREMNTDLKMIALDRLKEAVGECRLKAEAFKKKMIEKYQRDFDEWFQCQEVANY